MRGKKKQNKDFVRQLEGQNTDYCPVLIFFLPFVENTREFSIVEVTISRIFPNSLDLVGVGRRRVGQRRKGAPKLA